MWVLFSLFHGSIEGISTYRTVEKLDRVFFPWTYELNNLGINLKKVKKSETKSQNLSNKLYEVIINPALFTRINHRPNILSYIMYEVQVIRLG